MFKSQKYENSRNKCEVYKGSIIPTSLKSYYETPAIFGHHLETTPGKNGF